MENTQEVKLGRTLAMFTCAKNLRSDLKLLNPLLTRTLNEIMVSSRVCTRHQVFNQNESIG